MNNNLIIFGAGGFAREVAKIYYLKTKKNVSYISDDKSQWNQEISFGKVLSRTLESLSFKESSTSNYVVGIGSPSIKRSIVERIKKIGTLQAAGPLIDKTSIDCLVGNKIGEGTIVCSNCSITTDITIGKFVNINLNCTIGHDTIIEDYVNLSPGVHISGWCVVGEGTDIGTGAVILPKTKVGKNCIIGAGTVVTKDVPDNATIVGIPGKVIKINGQKI